VPSPVAGLSPDAALSPGGVGRRALHEAWMRRALVVAGAPIPAPDRAAPPPAGRSEVASGQADPPSDQAAWPAAADPGADVPVGAVLYGPDGTELGAGRNERELTADPTAHAEMLVLRRAAAALGTSRLDGCTLVVTLEPCTMCAGALVLARVATVVFGAWEPKTGALGSLWDVVRDRRLNHRPDVYAGVLEAECAALLRTFFRPPPAQE
jgi:tRNA(adenine34) deaminase